MSGKILMLVSDTSEDDCMEERINALASLGYRVYAVLPAENGWPGEASGLNEFIDTLDSSDFADELALAGI